LRFCLDDRVLGKANGEEMYFASAVLIATLGDVAIKAGIESILGNFDSTMLRLYRRIGCEVDVLASTQRYGQPTYLGLFPISDPILRRVKRKLKNAQSLMEKSKPGDLPWRSVDGRAAGRRWHLCERLFVHGDGNTSRALSRPCFLQQGEE
jgi:N-acyl-L-homoserine lactone synthetase